MSRCQGPCVGIVHRLGTLPGLINNLWFSKVMPTAVNLLNLKMMTGMIF